MTDFSVTAEILSDGLTVIHVSGEIDVFTASRLKEAVNERIDAGEVRLAIDLSDTDYLDSTALGALIGALKRCRDLGGEVVVAGPPQRISRVMQITGLDKVLQLQPTLDQACALLRGPGK